MDEFDPYHRAVARLECGDLVVCVPVRVEGELSWAVAGYDPGGFSRHGVPVPPERVAHFDPEHLGLALIEDARRLLSEEGVSLG